MLQDGKKKTSASDTRGPIYRQSYHGWLSDGNESDASRYATTVCLLYDVPTRSHLLPSACPVLRWAHSHTLVTKTTIPDVVVSECIPLLVPASVYPTASAPCPQIDFAFRQPGALPLRPAHTRRGMPAHLVSSLAAVRSSCGCRSAWLDSHTQPFFGSHEYAHWTHVPFTTIPLPCGRLSEVDVVPHSVRWQAGAVATRARVRAEGIQACPKSRRLSLRSCPPCRSRPWTSPPALREQHHLRTQAAMTPGRLRSPLLAPTSATLDAPAAPAGAACATWGPCNVAKGAHHGGHACCRTDAAASALDVARMVYAR